DPWVVRHDSSYYLVQSKDRTIWVYKSDQLTEPTQNGVPVWTAPHNGWNRSNVWAPELHYIDGRWYIYYAAGKSGPPFVYQGSGGRSWTSTRDRNFCNAAPTYSSSTPRGSPGSRTTGWGNSG